MEITYNNGHDEYLFSIFEEFLFHYLYDWNKGRVEILHIFHLMINLVEGKNRKIRDRKNKKINYKINQI
jgi:hypothetical protein